MLKINIKFLQQKIKIWRATGTVLKVNVIVFDYVIIPEQFHCEFYWLLGVFGIYAIKISSSLTDAKQISNRTTDTVVCHFSLLYRWLKEETRVIRNYIRDVIKYSKNGFSQGQIPLRWGKRGKKLRSGKKNTPFY